MGRAQSLSEFGTQCLTKDLSDDIPSIYINGIVSSSTLGELILYFCLLSYARYITFHQGIKFPPDTR